MISGQNAPDCFGTFDPSLHSLKMLEGCSQARTYPAMVSVQAGFFSTAYCQTFPSWGTVCCGKLYQQKPLVRLIDAIESGSSALMSWWIPVAQDGKHSGTNPSPNGERNLLANQVNWPTPTTQETEHPLAELTDTNRRKTATGDSHSLNLADSVKNWATPNTLDGMPPKSEQAILREATETRAGRTQAANLRDQVTNNWPTPTCQDRENCGGPSQFRRDSTPLNTAVLITYGPHDQGKPSSDGKPQESWPTPRAESGVSRKPGTGGKCLQEEARKAWATPQGRDYKEGSDPSPHGLGQISLPQQVCGQVKATTGKLNPTWVESLMGFPPNWTQLPYKFSRKTQRKIESAG